MGARGPKPVDVERLKRTVRSWACLLFGLRDGAPGMVERWGQTLTVELVNQNREPQEAERVERMLRKMDGEGWEVYWPVWPCLRIWEQLKHARSVKRMRKAVGALREWRRQNLNGVANDNLLQALESDPLDLLRAMGLPNYPRDPKTNDDKRVLFLAKVLAGLELGLAPLTATKKLSHWRCENYWKGVGVEYVASLKSSQKGERV